MGKHCLSITCDSGADVTVVPEECVETSQYTGEICEVASFNRKVSSGKLCNVTVTLAGRQFQRKAVAHLGADLGWTVCLSLPYRDREDRDYVTHLMDKKYESPETASQYTPPQLKEGVITTKQMVGEFDIHNADADTNVANSTTSDTESNQIECTVMSDATDTEGVAGSVNDETDGKEEVERDEEDEMILGEHTLTSVNDEAEGVLTGGSAVTEGEQASLVTEGIQTLCGGLKVSFTLQP